MKQNWDKLALHPMQTQAWGYFRSQMGNRVSFVKGDNQFLIVWSRIKFTPWWFGYIPMGPIPSKYDLEVIRKEAIKMSGVAVRMEPNAKIGNTIPNQLVVSRHLFKPKTFWVDLEKTEDDLLASMSSKCRYNIRLATKHGVKIIDDHNFVGDYLKLMFGKTTRRQRIYSHSEIYHERLWEILSKQSIAKMFSAKYENRVIACWIIFCWRDFVYYAYGAFDDDYKNLMAPVLGLWEIIKWGKRNGFKTLDLWGAEEGKGFSRFKEQFGPNLVEMVGSYDLPINKLVYKFFRIFEEIRWKILRAIK